jgi:hypothetical protein
MACNGALCALALCGVALLAHVAHGSDDSDVTLLSAEPEVKEEIPKAGEEWTKFNDAHVKGPFFTNFEINMKNATVLAKKHVGLKPWEQPAPDVNIPNSAGGSSKGYTGPKSENPLTMNIFNEKTGNGKNLKKLITKKQAMYQAEVNDHLLDKLHARLRHWRHHVRIKKSTLKRLEHALNKYPGVGRIKEVPGLIEAAGKATLARKVQLIRSQWRARKQRDQAMVALEHAKAKLQKIKMDNKKIMSKWTTVDTSGVESTACKPYPACLKSKAVCVDEYEAVNCIKARQGSNNLCAQSATIQKKCCKTCMMSALELCKRERMILAGFGSNPPIDPSAPAVAAHMSDKTCEEIHGTGTKHMKKIPEDPKDQQKKPTPS